MNRRQFAARAAAGTAAAGWAAAAGHTLFGRPSGPQLLNASYDATRELYRRVNGLFADHQLAATGQGVRLRPSHGGSGSQARAVVDGLPADVATLALWPDTDHLRQKGLIDAGWEGRFPDRSLPYTSCIVFVVRRGNPHAVRDWPDLVRGDLRLVTANPKTSGAAKLGVLAAWAAVTAAGGTAADAEGFVKAVFRRVPTLETSSRAATVTFARKRIGDVQLTWENEAQLEARESAGELEVVYPAVSLRAEPHVAVVDANARRNGTVGLAEAYLRFLYTPAAQDVFAENFFRPTTPAAEAKHAARFPAVRRVTVDEVSPGGWPAAQKQFFADGGLFDRVYGG